MKIAFVCQDLVGQGVQYATAIIARAFSRKGWEVDVLVSQVHFDLLKEGKQSFELPDAIKIVPMPTRRSSRNAFFLRQYLKKGGADVVLAESGNYSWSLTWASFGIPKSWLPKLAQVVHGNEDPVFGFKKLKKAFQFWYHYRKFTTLMFVNEESVKNFKKTAVFSRHLNVACVNNACVDEIFHEKVSLPPTHPWLMETAENRNWRTLLSAGSCDANKDHLTLIRAMAIVRDAGQKARLVIFGRGKLIDVYRREIEKLHLEDIVSVGQYSDRLPAEMKASGGFVLMSRTESFGIVLVEALACGVPCISTDAPYGPREILANGRYGRLVPVADPAAMAAAIVDLLNGKISVAPAESWRRYTIEAIEKRYFDAMGVK